MVERERLLFDLLKTDAVPLLDDFAINFEEGALASTVVLGNDLVQEAKNEQLESHSF